MSSEIEIVTREIEAAYPSFTQMIKAGGQTAREAIVCLERGMRAKMEAGELVEEVHNINKHHKHKFIDGLYAREMNAPKGTLIVGKIHKHPCFNFIEYGRILVFSEFGMNEVIGPCYFESKAGIKRVGIFLEDTKWVTIHNTKASNVEDAENDCVVDTYEEYNDFVEEQKLLITKEAP